MSIGVIVDDDDPIHNAIHGPPFSWETFLAIVNDREVQPNFETLFHDFL